MAFFVQTAGSLYHLTAAFTRLRSNISLPLFRIMSSVKHHLEPNDDNDQVGFFITTTIKVLIRRHCVLRQTDSRKKFKSLHYVDPGLRLLESTPVTNAENIGCGMFIMQGHVYLKIDNMDRSYTEGYHSSCESTMCDCSGQVLTEHSSS